ncbi:MAG: TIGR01777 family oxidoreductase [Candidatus Zixiibacteriota bacterium]
MRTLISGSGGLIGMALMASLKQRGYEIVRLVRRASAEGDILWSPEQNLLRLKPEDHFDIVVHLAGENIGAGRWTAGRKERILQSRVKGTQLLAESLTRLERTPAVFISASAVGYYGHRGDDIMREENGPGSGFLSEVCKAWETAADPVKKHGIRTVCLRFGMVLSPHGGALARMLLPFKLGLGGKFGDGCQYMSWIAIDDLVAVIHHVIYDASVSGPVNVVSPNPVTNAEFTKTLASVLHRPAIFNVPARALRLILGEMANALLLDSTRVEPAKLLATGFEFKYSDLRPALEYLLLQTP